MQQSLPSSAYTHVASEGTLKNPKNDFVLANMTNEEYLHHLML
jgi:hypothetical protein